MNREELEKLFLQFNHRLVKRKVQNQQITFIIQCITCGREKTKNVGEVLKNEFKCHCQRKKPFTSKIASELTPEQLEKQKKENQLQLLTKELLEITHQWIIQRLSNESVQPFACFAQ